MSNYPQADANGRIRPPSPPTIEAANGLLNFVSNHPPNVPQSLLASRFGLSSFPAAMHNAAAATQLAAMHRSMMAAASTSHGAFAGPHAINNVPSVGVAQKREPSKNDLIQAANPRRPCFIRPIDHPYTDYAPVSEAELQQLDQDDSILKSPTLSPEKKNLMEALRDMPPKCGSVLPFPSKLHEVVSNPELSDIITWMPHGRAFVVHDPDGLVTKVLPYYFSQTKFLSFIRQCNLWGFKRLTRGVEGKVYYHELFLRGRPYMALRIKRHKLKSHGFKPMPNPKGEPNFYSYSRVDELVPPHASVVENVDKEKKIDINDEPPMVATHPSQLFGVGSTDDKQDIGKEEKASTNESDSRFLTSFVVKSTVPPVAALPGSGLSAISVATTQPEVNVHDQDGIKAHASAMMSYRQAALSAAGAKTHVMNDDQLATKPEAKTNHEDANKDDASAMMRCRQAALSAADGKSDFINGKQAATNVEVNPNDEDPLNGDVLAMLRYRQAALAASDAPASTYANLVAAEKHLLSAEATNARLAAITAAMKTSEPDGGANLSAHYAALMGLGDIRGLNTGLNQYSAPRSNMNDLLNQRLVHLQREQNEIELLRRATMLNDFSSRSGQSQLVAGFSSPPWTSQAVSDSTMPMSVAEALQEAKHFEELATASRNRARMLALTQPGFDTSKERESGGDQS